jgi:GT2 family glycosyltransferase
MPTLAIIIVSFNTRALLHACLESLRSCRLPLQTLVVDNASHDGSQALVREHFPEVTLLALDQNVGFAAANNRGLHHLGIPENNPTPYVLLLNPDTVVHPQALETMVAFLDAHPRVGVVGPRLLNPDGSLQRAAFRFPTLSMTLLDLFPPGEVLPGRLYNSWWHGRYSEELGDQPFAIDHPLGACMLVRRDVICQVGAFDERFFMYAEEVDWCYRIRQAGWAIWQQPQAQVTHVGGAATSQFRGAMLRALYASRLRYFRKHLPNQHVLLHRLIIQAGMLRMTLRAWWAFANGRLSVAELRQQLWTYGKVTQL